MGLATAKKIAADMSEYLTSGVSAIFVSIHQLDILFSPPPFQERAMESQPPPEKPKRVPDYFGQLKRYFEEKKNQGAATLGTMALEKFGKSKYARQQLSTVPTSIMAGALKSVFNFLILYRLATSIPILDFFISVLVTVVLAAISPVFYVIAKEREADIMAFSNHFADHLFYYGFDYLRMWRGRTVAAMGLSAILFLLCFEVNSTYLIQVVIEMLVAFWVVDQVNNFRDSIFKPLPIKVSFDFIAAARPQQLTKHDFIKVPLKKAVRAETLPNVIDHYMQPKRATLLAILSDVKNAIMETKARNVKVGGSTRKIIDDWVRL